MNAALKRTPKNYDGSTPTGKKLCDLLPQVLSKISKRCSHSPSEILAAWPDIVGERIGKMSEAIRYGDGILEVHVKNSTLYSLFVEHEKCRLVAAFRKKFPNIPFSDILFKIGRN